MHLLTFNNGSGSIHNILFATRWKQQTTDITDDDTTCYRKQGVQPKAHLVGSLQKI